MLFVYGTKNVIHRLQNKHPISHPYSETQCLILITQSAFFCPLLNYFPTILCTMGLTIIEYYDKIIFCAAPPSPLSVSDRWVVGGDGS